MSNKRVYWNSVDHLNNDPEFVAKAQNEFSTDLPVSEFLGKEELKETSTSRRDFLKFVGFSVAAATLAACEAPVVKSIPYVIKPEEITPGVANYYASTYFDGLDYASILVKTREGRPIFIKGNKLSTVTGGATNARINASVLGLYDEARYRQAKMNGADTEWSALDKAVMDKMAAAAAKGGNIRVLSNTTASPSTNAAIAELAKAYEGANVQHVQYDTYSYSGIMDANMANFGAAVVPTYNFDEAKTIVSFGADFLGNWLNSVEYTPAYAKRRNPSGKWMSKHYQFETTFTLTGTNADKRSAIKPSEQAAAIATLYNEVAKATGNATVKAGTIDDDNHVMANLKEAAKSLVKSKGHGLVIANSNNADTQLLINGINAMLNNYGTTIDVNSTLNTKAGSDQALAGLVSELKGGKVDVLVVYGANPVYNVAGFETAMAKAGYSVAIACGMNETAEKAQAVAADNHFLESWNDVNPSGANYSVVQPTINPLFKTRQGQESLLTWAGSTSNMYDYMRMNWEANMFPNQTKYSSFETFWNTAVHDGVFTLNATPTALTYTAGDMAMASANAHKAVKAGGLEVEFYLETAMGDGNQANNPWLQEMPHPVSKVTWDNYIAMNPVDMEMEGYPTKYGEQSPAKTAEITVNGVKVELPVVAMPGQKRGTAAIALGYGRDAVAGKVIAQGDQNNASGKTIGVNVYPMVSMTGGTAYYGGVAEMSATNNDYVIASTQTHGTMMGRKIVNETSMKTFKENGREVWNPDVALANAYGEVKPVEELDLWGAQDLAIGHHWGMSIDLSSCIGCGACVVSCHSENNVAVVGKDEVRRTRTMHWLRVDRYFSSDMTKQKGAEEGKGSIEMYAEMENPSAYPEVVYQPVMCQQCNHAPCETVCPVAATNHSNEGLNQMAYNRCIGTRYCANNCPYKVRRFNWFNYVGDSKFTEVNPSQNDLARMVLNPDVVVRSRGVMEKCSFCVQRIQAGKLEAKKAGRPVVDGDVVSACADACPTNAIQFGDVNDKNSTVAHNISDDRSYNMLEEIGVKPNVWYMTKVRNIDEHRLNETVAENPHAGHSADHGHDHEEAHAHGTETEEHNHAH